MFTWLNKQGVESDKGFVVQRVDRFTTEYHEGTKVISIWVESGCLPNDDVCVYITPDAFNEWDDGTPISAEKQDEIFKNFKDAMEFKGITVLVD